MQGTVNAYFSASHSIFDFIATEGMLSTLMVQNSIEYVVSVQKRDKVQNIPLSPINRNHSCSLFVK